VKETRAALARSREARGQRDDSERVQDRKGLGGGTTDYLFLALTADRLFNAR
jgi:hypothetical protein